MECNMEKKNNVEVIINNKIYTICGFESDEYLQKIASYINVKYSDFKAREEYTSLTSDLKTILLEINMADDYFKAKKQSQDYLAESEDKTKEIYDLKHEVVSAQTKVENLNKELEQTKANLVQAQKQIVKLEAELADARK